jgi:lipopolysaccharide transport system ATP-binding protein
MRLAIRTDNLGKRYRVVHKGKHFSYHTLRESLVNAATATARWLRGAAVEDRTEEFWALREIDLEIRPGDVMGFIGRNGAGKSTLLKILARITKPTTGHAEIYGRVGSLLEVGTGFHPELTGRENIFLNGSILGMSRREINRRFEEIVAFSEIEDFLDTPVKRYSSGMYVRLAFAVAAHLEPEILIVDEVLAVGDAEFQRKCIGQMGHLAGEGRTILFVSHDMNAITRLTTRAALLEKGRVIHQGSTEEVVRCYLSRHERVESEAEWERPSRERAAGTVVIRSVRVRDGNGRVTSHFRADEPIVIEFGFAVMEASDAQIAFRLNRNDDGTTIFTSALSDQLGQRATRLAAGAYQTRCYVPAPFLTPGSYHLLVAANNPKGPQHDMIDRVLNFDVSEIGSPKNHDRRLGYVTPIIPWTITQLDADAIQPAGCDRPATASPQESCP